MPLLQGHALACSRGGREVFHDLTFSLEVGETLLITGANGSGKSTLLRLIAGLVRASEGTLSYKGNSVSDDRAAFQADLCYIGHADALKNVLSVEENLAFWDRSHSSSAEQGDSIAAALEQLDLLAFRDVSTRLLSAGQRHRLALARLLVSSASVWLLDEPSVALDSTSQEKLFDILKGHGNKGGITLLTTHSEIDLPRCKRLTLDEFAVHHHPELIW
jgi:heme exporter protein A